MKMYMLSGGRLRMSKRTYYPDAELADVRATGVVLSCCGTRKATFCSTPDAIRMSRLILKRD